jgi:hypothetical protein
LLVQRPINHRGKPGGAVYCPPLTDLSNVWYQNR